MINQPVAGVQKALTTTLHQPTLTGDFGKVGFAVQHGVEFKSGVAAENHPVDRFPINQATRHRFGLEASEEQHHFRAGQRAIERLSVGDGRFFVDLGGQQNGFDSGGAQGCEAGR